MLYRERTHLPPATAADKAKRHREIARLYAWQRRSRRGFTRRATLIMLVRLRELERLFAFRYGDTLPNDDSERDDLIVAAHTIAALEGDVAAWARQWAPWFTAAEIRKLVASTATPSKFSAATLAWRLHLTDAERTALKITTIGAVDVTKAERLARRKQRKAARKAARRREAGAKPQASSLSRTKPWQAAGMSRATWYRQRRKSR